MCGIAGMVDLSGNRREPNPAVIRAMADVMFHRGPDEDGYLIRRGIGFANRRLSIVGLADGKQPIGNETGSVECVFNGEFFDYPERKRELMSHGHTFKTHCDTELIPHTYEEKGDKLTDGLRGQFAFALVDHHRGRVIIARDRFGICPLYWTKVRDEGGEWLLFGSEIKTLLASGMVKAKPDHKGLAILFTCFGVPGPRTCFEGISLLPPGHKITIDLGGGGLAANMQETAYYRLDFPTMGNERRGADAALANEFEEKLLGSVKRRLHADVPVVSYLSGGVDSGIVVAMASKVLGRAIPAFTIAIQDPKLDETSDALVAARHVGAHPISVKFGKAEIQATYPELIQAAESPVIDTSCGALLLLARAVRQNGYKVALTGEGSDEWMAGYPWHKANRVLNRLNLPFLPLGRVARKLIHSYWGVPKVPQDIIERSISAAGGYNGWHDIYGLNQYNRFRFFSEDMHRRVGDFVPFEDFNLPTEEMKKWHPLHRELYISGRCHLPGLLLNAKGDRVAMHSSVETRYPFLDEEVFEFLASVHPDHKFKGLGEKHILRLVAEKYLPKECAWRRKAMFRAPFDSFEINEQSEPYINQLLSDESVERAGYFQPNAIRYWRDRAKAYRQNAPVRTTLEMGLVGVLATQLWHHLYIDPNLCELPDWKSLKPDVRVATVPCEKQS
ncbi:MAG: asparagine synthase (glutamine-hydrolyzing) [Planctomycetota bacterium]|nr:asparagine synthase (glutamine-hydrolyzing) [Planctomycetota bacterium]RLT17919.1 MAG: asparagine synthase (glutamine-hydrolyzing) [Planctomycetota bacterium]